MVLSVPSCLRGVSSWTRIFIPNRTWHSPRLLNGSGLGHTLVMRPRRSRAVVLTLAVLAWGGVAVERAIFAQQPGATLGMFYCPMHPDITATAEARCARCGMTLVPGDPLDAREYAVDMTATPPAVRPGRPVRLTFTIRHPDTGATVRTFATVHEKPFHLFVVSHDLDYYDHVHPDMQADGSWTIDLTLPEAGYYKLFSDFLPLGGTPQVVPRLLAAGDAGDLAAARAQLPSDDGFEKTAGSMTVALSLPADGLVAGRDETLRYHIVDAKTGRPVTNLEPYLAAYGHTLVLSEDTLEYVHAHPVELLPEKIDTAAGGPDLTFKALLPKPGRYRLWTQLKRDDVVTTARFTVTAASPVGR
jgi:heavy metal-binding protein